MSLQVELKKSAVSQKLPFPSDLALGEIALNYNADGPFLTCKDTAGNIRKLNRVWVAATAPSSPTAGDPWLDTSGATALLRIYDGSAWTAGVTVPLATTSTYGTVQLATSADITNGTAGKIVDAAQLQSKITTELSATPITFQQVQVVGNTTIGGNLAVNGTTTTFDSIASHPLGSAGAPTITFTGDTNTGIYSPSADQVAISTNGTGRLFISNDGKIGIGTASPLEPLHVEAGSADLMLRSTLSTGNSRIFFGDPDATNAGSIAYTHTDNSLSVAVNGSERARITSDGKLGLGTSSPSERLTNTGNFQNTGNAVIGTGSLWTFANSWRGIKISDRHAIQATPAANAIAISSNAAIGASGWEYTVSGESAANYTIAGSNHIFHDAASGTDGSAVTFTERMRITPTGVGVGTTSPSVAFEVKTASTAAHTVAAFGSGSIAGGLEVTTNGNLDWGFNALNSRNLTFSTNQLERARIDSSGRLLVGTSSAQSVSSVGLTPALQLNSSSSSQSGSTIGLFANSATNNCRLALFRNRATTAGGFDYTGGTVQSDDVLGEIEFYGVDGQATPTMRTGASIKAVCESTPTTAEMPSRLVFSVTADGASSPTERMRITREGSIWINTTSATVQNNGGAVIIGDSTGSFLDIARNANLAGRFGRFNSDGSVVAFNRDATTVGSISVTTTATAYNTSSDYRLKENVTAVTDGITRLQQLKPSRFNFIADPDKTVDGFLAHEVQNVVPEAITGEKDAVDENGDPQYQGIDQSKIVPLVVAALQEAIGEIESLKARVAALEQA